MRLMAALCEKLWFKVMVPIAALLLVILGIIIFGAIRTQQTLVRDQIKHDGEVLVLAIEGAMFSALARGDNDTVMEQLQQYGGKSSDLEIYVFDPNLDIAFATDPGARGKSLKSRIQNESAMGAAAKMIETSVAPLEPVEELLDGKPSLSLFRPILNEARCHQCHDGSGKLLGGIQVRTSVAKTMAAAAAARTRNIALSAAGLAVMILLIYLLFCNLVNGPVRVLLEAAGKMREGDLTARLELKGRDELRHVCARMNFVNENLRKMVGEIVEASHGLSDVATEQAASLEQTCSALQEISSMTKQNAGNAKNADDLMTRVKEVVACANASMAELTLSMDEITKASEETSKIVKTVDEIAFQTNILALNAAVEAARAGGAGAAFAVVAEEVRNLSLQAAGAVRNTNALIEGTLDRVRKGATQVTRTNELFSEVASSISGVVGLVAEIALASDEQARGIGEINRAFSEIGGTTQRNAASAEQLAGMASSFNIGYSANDSGPGNRARKKTAAKKTGPKGNGANRSGRQGPAARPPEIQAAAMLEADF